MTLFQYQEKVVDSITGILPTVSRDPLSMILSPFRGIRLQDVYHQHASIIDFVIFLILFIGISRATIGKKFPGTPGRIMSVALGIILALSLSITQHRMNFNLASLGPFALVMLLAIAGIMLSQMLISLGIHNKISIAIAYIAIYASIRAFSPSFFDWLVRSIPFLAGIMSLSLIAAMLVLLFAIFPKLNQRPGADISMNLSPGVYPKMQKISSNVDSAERVSQGLVIDDEDVFKRFNKIRQYLLSLIENNEGRTHLIDALRGVNLKKHDLYERFQRLQNIDKAIQKQDLEMLQKLYTDLKRIPKERSSMLITALNSTRERINLEKEIAAFENKIESIMEKMGEIIRICCGAIERGDVALARRSIDDAIQLEKSTKTMLSGIAKLERVLKSLIDRFMKNAPKSQKQRSRK